MQQLLEQLNDSNNDIKQLNDLKLYPDNGDKKKS